MNALVIEKSGRVSGDSFLLWTQGKHFHQVRKQPKKESLVCFVWNAWKALEISWDYRGGKYYELMEKGSKS